MNDENLYSLGDIREFIRCELRMRVYEISASDMCNFGVSKNSFGKYKAVRSVMTKADVPPSVRKVIHGSSQIPAFSFDPIMDKAIRACTDEWKMFFVMGSSWVDIDDDKIPNTSPK